MTTASTSTVADQTTDAGFRTWVAEIITQLTACGLSQAAEAGQINTSTVTRAAINTAAGYALFRYTDTLGKGPLATVNAIVGGSAYTAGTYTAVPLTGGSGSGAQATIVVAGGVVTTVTVTTAGTGYAPLDVLSAAAANIGGTGSGFTCQVATLTSGSPVVIKLEFGSAGVNTTPQMWITTGTGTNGSGTLTGTLAAVSTRVAVLSAQPINSTSTAYSSRFVYNATYGYCAMIWKIGAFGGTAGAALGGFVIFRSNDSTGAATGDAVMLWSNSLTATGSTSPTGLMQCVSYLVAGSNFPTTQNVTNNGAWSGAIGGIPFGLTGTTYLGNSYLTPVLYMTPAICVSAYTALGLVTEAPLGNTFTTALVGATTLTFLSVQYAFGNSGGSLGGFTNANITVCILWQ
jgi:hypothetical protein